MKLHDATEMAYKNGYEQGKKDAVVHGRWERCFEDWRQQIEGDKCSACGFEHYGCGIKYYHYCPNCGADMRDGDSDV